MDYGEESEITSEPVRRCFYDGNATGDVRALIDELNSAGKAVIIGHFDLDKYMSVFEPDNLLSFVREPLVRACSEYIHRSRDGSYSGSIEMFLESPHRRNKQSEMLRGRPADMFIGVTERYRDSLIVINRMYQLKLTNKRRNKGPIGGGLRLAQSLDERTRQRFYDLNEEDCALYKHAVRQLEKTSQDMVGG